MIWTKNYCNKNLDLKSWNSEADICQPSLKEKLLKVLEQRSRHLSAITERKTALKNSIHLSLLLAKFYRWMIEVKIFSEIPLIANESHAPHFCFRHCIDGNSNAVRSLESILNFTLPNIYPSILFLFQKFKIRNWGRGCS